MNEHKRLAADIVQGDKTLLHFGYLELKDVVYMDYHVSLEVTYFKEAEGVYTINGKDYEFKCNDLFLMPSNIRHEVTKVTKKGYICNILFDSRFLWDSVNFWGMDDFLQIFRGNPDEYQYMLDRSNPACKKIINLIEEIHREFKCKEKCYEHMVRIYMQNIFVTIYRNFNYEETKEFSVDRHNIKAMSKSIDYIDSHLCDNLRLDAIAAVANICPTYYGTIFKKLYGITPWEYITSKRIELAIDKLKKGDYTTMHELAYECGFNNTVNFNRAFKKYTGMVPTKYIKLKCNLEY